MAFFGFFFWIINARLFSTEQVGLATTLISVMGLITSFSLLGLNTGLIRYLPKSDRKNDKISTCFSVTALATIAISVIFLLGLKTFSPRLLFIRESLPYTLFFIFFMVISSLSNILESVFIAFRNTKFVFIQNTVFSISKLVLPFSLVTLGTYGIFSSWMIALTISLGVSFVILITKFSYKPQPIIHKNIIKEIGRFSFGNYIASFLAGLPIMVLPLMITNMINPETTAHYYMAMMIASLLFIIPVATTQSLFAEGSHDGQELKQHVKKALKIIILILVPAILISAVFGKYILLAFGESYSTEGFIFLQILSLSGIFIGINSIFVTILKVKRQIRKIIFISLIESVLILGFSYVLLSKGLIGIGLAWIIGQGVVSIIYFTYEGWGKVVNFCIYFIHNNGLPLVHYKQIWSIGIYIGESPISLASVKNINPVLTAKDVTDAPAEFVADPFMVKDHSTWYMFFEVMNKTTKRGEIGAATSCDGFNWKYKQIVLKEPFHLSYPYVFKWQNEYFMIPESYEANSIRLYKAVDFPAKWSFVGTLLDKKDFVDSSIFHFHDKWWLFTTSTKSNILRLYHADNLIGPWMEHPNNPIISENAHIARPGGRVLLLNNQIIRIRYTQDDFHSYGNQVRAFEIIELTATSYKEREIAGNPVLQANGTGWNAKGMHHIDPHQIGKNKWIACVDGNMEILKFGFSS